MWLDKPNTFLFWENFYEGENMECRKKDIVRHHMCNIQQTAQKNDWKTKASTDTYIKMKCKSYENNEHIQRRVNGKQNSFRKYIIYISQGNC